MTDKTRAEELQAQINDLDTQMDELRAEKDKLANEYESLATSEKVAAQVEAMNEKERSALFQALEAKGIASAGGVGTPGG